jgi:PST family polysaccharide transporter
MTFMVSGFLIMGAAFLVRAMVLREEGLEAAGFYQAAWTLGGLYVGMVLQAMSADFFPRLSEVADNDELTNRYVNEQTEISLLLAGPGIIGTLALAPLLMVIFYSSDFEAAVSVLRWICLGMALRVISWPLGFIVVARAEQRLFLLTEAIWTAANIGLCYFLITRVGLDGAGMGFLGSYLIHSVMIYFIVRRLSGFRLSTPCGRIIVLYVLLTAAVFVALSVLPGRWAMISAAVGLSVSSYCSLRGIAHVVNPNRIPRIFLGPLRRLRVIPSKLPVSAEQAP